MKNHNFNLDIHTHSIASGHGSGDTLNDMAKAAKKSGLSFLGISDHGPSTPGSAKSSYFRGLSLAPKKRMGIDIIYGCECNILNEKGDLDLDDKVLSTLDYALVAMHPPTYHVNCKPKYRLTDKLTHNSKGKQIGHTGNICVSHIEYPVGTPEINLNAYLAACVHPKVCFLAHPEDSRFPVDLGKLIPSAAELGVYPEINNASLMPGAYRMGGSEGCREILRICRRNNIPVLLSSDSHGGSHIGDFDYILPLLEETQFPHELILNSNVKYLKEILKKKCK